MIELTIAKISGEYNCEQHHSSHYVLKVVNSGAITYSWSYGHVCSGDIVYAFESGYGADLAGKIAIALGV